MSVDLGDLVEFVKVEVNPPGTELFADATDAEWITRLQNAFWNARLDGMLAGYVEADGEITPETGSTDMPRELQQVIVFMAGYAALMQRLSSIRTGLRAKAGPVEFETQNSATVLHDQALALKDRLDRILYLLSEIGFVPSYVIDSVRARAESLAFGTQSWVR